MKSLICRLLILFVFPLLATYHLHYSATSHERSNRYVAGQSSADCLPSLREFFTIDTNAVLRQLSTTPAYGPKITSQGTEFTIWLPNAREVEIITDLNGWKEGHYHLVKDNQGNWRGTIPTMDHGSQYKIKVVDATGRIQYRIDPYSPYVIRDDIAQTWNGVVWNPKNYKWINTNYTLSDKMALVEVHPGTVIPGNPQANWREIADYLVEEYGDKATHFSFMPVVHHNLYESWGYQTGAIYSIDYRHGTPDDFKYLVDRLHGQNKGVILDFVYGHTSKDWDTGLGGIDGTQIYFKAPEQYNGKSIDMGSHPEWGTYIYNYGSQDVQNYLLNNAKFWVEEYKIDGARMDAIHSMILQNYQRKDGEWIPHPIGGMINQDAVNFLQKLNVLFHHLNENFVSIAEDMSGLPNTTASVANGGLGFDYIWGIGSAYNYRNFLRSPENERNLYLLLEAFREDWGNHRYINYITSHDEAAHNGGWALNVINARSTPAKVKLHKLMQVHLYITMPGHPMIFQDDHIARAGKWDAWLPHQNPFQAGQAHQNHNGFLAKLAQLREQFPSLKRSELGSSIDLWIDQEKQVLARKRVGLDPNDDLIVVTNFSSKKVKNFQVPIQDTHRNWKVELASEHYPFRKHLYGTDREYGVTLSVTLPPYTSVILSKSP